MGRFEAHGWRCGVSPAVTHFILEDTIRFLLGRLQPKIRPPKIVKITRISPEFGTKLLAVTIVDFDVNAVSFRHRHC